MTDLELNVADADEAYKEELEYLENIHEEEEKPFSYFDLLDAPRYLPEPVDLTLDHVKEIAYELGLIKLYWPEITDPFFEDRVNFPSSYLKNDDKEKLVLLYAENFRRQFCFKYPNRKPLLLACENECGMQKMVCTTIRPTTLPYPEIETWQQCAQFVADQLKFEPYEDLPTLIPRRLYSPHTTFLRQSGQPYEIATALCSLLIGLGYDAYVVSGYAIQDVTMRIMSRVEAPYVPVEEEEEVVEEAVAEEKYKLRQPRDLRSKFLLMMQQRERDKVKAEQEKVAEEKRQRMLEEEKRPPDDLEGQRVHGWVILLAGERNVENTIFIEPSTGMAYPLDTDIYCGIESVWNHLNYWVNMQDCSEGVGCLEYDLTNTEKWEHLLVGEPITRRKQKPRGMDEDEENEMYEEKHLDMPMPWSLRINIPHEVLKRRFPDGIKVTYYKRTSIEEYAPYVSDDGLLTRIVKYEDFLCTEVKSVEERFENRHDKLKRIMHDYNTDMVIDYFDTGRDDNVIKHIYYQHHEAINDDRTIFYNHKARYDGLAKVEINTNTLTEHFEGREDRLYYRQIVYTGNENLATEPLQGNRRPILKVTQKFRRNEELPANKDIAVREFAVADRSINLKYHYAKGSVTASTRVFLKPPIAEMGEAMVFKPELTYGYQAEIGAKLPRQLTLFLLLEQQLKDEVTVIGSVRDTEVQLSEFLLQRAHEMAFPKLDVSLFNKEQNMEYRLAMLEKEQEARIHKEKEVEEDMDYLAPYLARLGNPKTLTLRQATDVRARCLTEFKHMLVARANNVQKTFEKVSEQLLTKQNWYNRNQDTILPEEEKLYFQEVKDLNFYLRALEIHLNRHKDLASLRYNALVTYLNNHPMLWALKKKKP